MALEAVKAKDYVTAGRHFKNAALCGHVDAQYNYGVSLSNGELGEADPLEGAFWYFMAARGGNAKAMVNLAIAYRRGTGVSENGPMMLYWYAKGATVPSPYAVYCLGLCLKDEEVIPNNVSLGRTLIIFSERLCDDRACNFVKETAEKIIDALRDHAYNI
jgi:TPR repeat protein